jgi:hypothetical protein
VLSSTNKKIIMPNQFITLEQAQSMIKKYKDEKENILDSAYRSKDILPNCETFDRVVFDKVLAQDNCVKLRVYFSMDENFLVKAIVVGVDPQDNDILPEENGIIENGWRCPDMCPPPGSSLNG